MKASASVLKIRAFGLAFLVLVACSVVNGCKPGGKKITDLQRKEAAHLDSEAQFAVTMRQWERAEGLYAKAAELCPDTGLYWLSLGVSRMQLGKRDAAKEAYKGALKAFQHEVSLEKTDIQPWLKQVEVLALLGRVDDARALLEKAAKQFPNDRAVRSFIENKALDRMLADPTFKQNAL
jgi:tetratricopeptide (TPR) repeat protein